ncbi:MAG: MogA/MoaB family molybdenum cofactor biosynthesis protein [Desulfovibrio sp.]|nr:MogA/MoaB family molybdenum cofactor biosynthesis protein [Desulfovibrio sp.]
MIISIKTQACAAQEILPLLPVQIKPAYPSLPAHQHESFRLPPLAVGTQLRTDPKGPAVFIVVGQILLPSTGNPPHAPLCPLLKAQKAIEDSTSQNFSLVKEGLSLAWITLSDKGALGQRKDTAGPLIAEILGSALPLCHSQGFLLPDDAFELRSALTYLSLTERYDIICTSGGTGLTERDITPETTERLLDRSLPGFTQAMMAKSLEKTPNAILSRACAGIIGQTLVLNLPGSAKAVRENLEAILPALDHTLKKMHNDPSDCGG